MKSHTSLLLTVLWLLLTLGGLLSQSHLSHKLTTSLQIPGSQSAQVEQILKEEFGESSEGAFTVIYFFKELSGPDLSRLEEQIDRSAQVIPGSRIVAQRALSGTLFTLISTDYTFNEASHYVQPLRASLKESGLNDAVVTGPAAVAADSNPLLKRDLQRGRNLAISICIVLLFLAFGFSLLTLLPIIFGVVIVATTMLLLNVLASFFPLMLYTPNLVELFGFGLALDFSILLGYRIRTGGGDLFELLPYSLIMVKRTIRFSTVSITLGLVTLIAIDVPFIRSIGIALIVLPGTLLAGVYLFMPALITLCEKYLQVHWKFPGFLVKRTRQLELKSDERFRTLPSALGLFCGMALLIPLLSQLPQLHITPSALTSIPTTVESGKALAAIGSQVGAGVVTPHILIADFERTNGATQPENKTKVSQVIDSLSQNSSVFAIATDNTPTFVDATGRYQRIFVFTRSALGSNDSRKFVDSFRNQLAKFHRDSSSGVSFYLGGAPAQGEDLLAELTSKLPIILPIILIVLMCYLMFVLRSILLPIIALILDGVALAASLGALTFLLNRGWIRGEFGIFQSSALEIWVLLFLGVVLFGLSMDYEIFLLSRINEERNSSDNLQAIDNGVKKTRSVIGLAALIMVGSVSGLTSSDFPILSQLGAGLTIGIILDVLVVRLLLLPAAIKLLHPWIWKFPFPTKK